MAVTEDFSFPKLTTNKSTTTTKNDDDDEDDNKNPLSHFTIPSTPSLWRISSLVYPDDDEDEEQGENDNRGREGHGVVSRRNVKSFSDLESDQDYRLEEKMDSLWEDFNDRDQVVLLHRVSSLDNRRKSGRNISRRLINNYPNSDYNGLSLDDGRRRLDSTVGIAVSDLDDDGDDDNDKPRFMKALKLKVISKGSSLVKVKQRPKRSMSMVVLLRAMRKLFLLHNLARDKKTR